MSGFSRQSPPSIARGLRTMFSSAALTSSSTDGKAPKSPRETIGAVATMEQFKRRYERLSRGENGGFHDEYAKIRSVSDKNTSARNRITPGDGQIARRNRYTNVLTFDDTRVRLRTEQSEECDYINASFVAYEQLPPLIVAQGPLKNTSEHFWQMCWERDVPLVVMLTEFEDHVRHLGVMQEKCFRYFAMDSGTKVQFGCFVVECAETLKRFPGWTERKIILYKLDSSDAPKELLHIHCDEWPDYGTLDAQQLEGLRWSLKVSSDMTGAGRGPVTVHCSAGIGRSGTFVALHDLLAYAQANRWDLVDPSRVVSALRNQRAGMVQTLGQYQMIYDVTALLTGCIELGSHQEFKQMERDISSEDEE